MKGYLIVSRSLWDHWIWRSEKQSMRWLDLIYLANWEDKTIEFGNGNLELKRGQFATTTRILMNRWRTNSDTVRRFLKLLEKHDMIKCRRKRDMTVISIINYDLYQGVKFLQSDGDILPETFVGVAVDFPTQNLSQNDVVFAGDRVREGVQIELNNKVNNQTSLSPREREIDFFEEIKSSQMFLETAAKNHGLTVEQVLAFLNEFHQDKTCLEHWHRDLADYRHHFYNWLKIQIDNKKKQDERQRKKENAGGGRGDNPANGGEDPLTRAKVITADTND